MPVKQLCSLRREQLEAERQEDGALPVGEKSEVADAHEAAWQQMEQESAQELLDIQSHEPLLVAMGGVSPLEGDIALRESDQPAVGDGDAMGVGARLPCKTWDANETRSRFGTSVGTRCLARNRSALLPGEASYSGTTRHSPPFWPVGPLDDRQRNSWAVENELE